VSLAEKSTTCRLLNHPENELFRNTANIDFFCPIIAAAGDTCCIGNYIRDRLFNIYGRFLAVWYFIFSFKSA